MTQMSENVRVFLSMRDAWTKEVGKNQFSKAVRIINSAYLFRRNNFDYNDWQQLVAITEAPLYKMQLADIISRTKDKILNTSMDVLSWFIIYKELSIAGRTTNNEKVRKRLSSIRKDMFSKADWENLIKDEPSAFIRDGLINEMFSAYPIEAVVIDRKWREHHKKILAKVAKYIKTGEPVSGPDLLAAIDAGIDTNILKYLIHNCNDINYHDKNGQTALHHCALHDIDLEVLNELLVYGANSAAQDKERMEARDYLAENLWGEDYGKARAILRPLWTWFYDG